MIIDQEILLVILGAVVALISSLLTVIVQNSIEQRNKKLQEKDTKQKLAYEAKIESNIDKIISKEDSFLSQALQKFMKIDEELSTRDMSSVSTDRLIELNLNYSQFVLDYQNWIKSGIRNEAERVNVLGVDFYKELKFNKD
jgi:hypothetical protein